MIVWIQVHVFEFPLFILVHSLERPSRNDRMKGRRGRERGWRKGVEGSTQRRTEARRKRKKRRNVQETRTDETQSGLETVVVHSIEKKEVKEKEILRMMGCSVRNVMDDDNDAS